MTHDWALAIFALFMVILGCTLIFSIFYFFIDWEYSERKIQIESIVNAYKPSRRDLQKELDDILKEAEKMREELPLVTLWWGLDGLQMNRDGMLEWISKKPKPVEPYWLGPDLIHSYPIPTYPLACMRAYQPILYGLDCQNASPEDRISFLEAQERELTLAIAQSYQTRAILDNLKQWEVVNEEKGSYVKVTDISGNSYLEPCVWTHSQEKHTL